MTSEYRAWVTMNKTRDNRHSTITFGTKKHEKASVNEYEKTKIESLVRVRSQASVVRRERLVFLFCFLFIPLRCPRRDKRNEGSNSIKFKSRQTLVAGYAPNKNQENPVRNVTSRQNSRLSKWWIKSWSCVKNQHLMVTIISEYCWTHPIHSPLSLYHFFITYWINFRYPRLYNSRNVYFKNTKINKHINQ